MGGRQRKNAVCNSVGRQEPGTKRRRRVAPYSTRPDKPSRLFKRRSTSNPGRQSTTTCGNKALHPAAEKKIRIHQSTPITNKLNNRRIILSATPFTDYSIGPPKGGMCVPVLYGSIAFGHFTPHDNRPFPHGLSTVLFGALFPGSSAPMITLPMLPHSAPRSRWRVGPSFAGRQKKQNRPEPPAGRAVYKAIGSGRMDEGQRDQGSRSSKNWKLLSI